MVMNLLQICQAAADEMGVTRPVALIAGTSANDRQFLALANRAGVDLQDAGDWVELIRTYTFTPVEDVAEYALPDDFDRMIVETVWDTGQLMPVAGPLTPQEWQAIKSGLIGNGIYFDRFVIRRGSTSPLNRFWIDPTPGADPSSIVYQYFSTNWCASSDYASTYATWNADTNVPLLPDRLFVLSIIWRYLRANGIEYATQFQEYENELVKTLNANRPAPTLSLNGNIWFQPQLLSPWNAPDTGIGG